MPPDMPSIRRLTIGGNENVLLAPSSLALCQPQTSFNTLRKALCNYLWNEQPLHSAIPFFGKMSKYTVNVQIYQIFYL